MIYCGKNKQTNTGNWLKFGNCDLRLLSGLMLDNDVNNWEMEKQLEQRSEVWTGQRLVPAVMVVSGAQHWKSVENSGTRVGLRLGLGQRIVFGG